MDTLAGTEICISHIPKSLLDTLIFSIGKNDFTWIHEEPTLEFQSLINRVKESENPLPLRSILRIVRKRYDCFVGCQ